MAVIGGISSLGGSLVRRRARAVDRLRRAPAAARPRPGAGLLVILLVLPGRARAGLRAAARPLRSGDGAAPRRRAGRGARNGRRGRSPDAAAARVGAGRARARCSRAVRCRASYGSLDVLFGVDAEVREGELVALLGTNGAGKSTLLKAVTGLLPPTGGRVVVRRTRRSPDCQPNSVAALGHVTDAGRTRRVPDAHRRREPPAVVLALRKDTTGAEDGARARARAVPGPARARSGRRPGTCPAASSRCSRSRWRSCTRPKLLCIDELSLGLAPTVVGRLVDTVREIHRQGTTVVLVEQSVNVALLLAERAVFLEKGQVRFRGSVSGLLERPDVLRAVFIGKVDDGAGDACAPCTSSGARGERRRAVAQARRTLARQAFRRHRRRRRRRPRRRARVDRRTHRTQRRRQDDALRSAHRVPRTGRGPGACSATRTSPNARRTAARSSASDVRSRRRCSTRR